MARCSSEHCRKSGPQGGIAGTQAGRTARQAFYPPPSLSGVPTMPVQRQSLDDGDPLKAAPTYQTTTVGPPVGGGLPPVGGGLPTTTPGLMSATTYGSSLPRADKIVAGKDGSCGISAVLMFERFKRGSGKRYCLTPTQFNCIHERAIPLPGLTTKLADGGYSQVVQFNDFNLKNALGRCTIYYSSENKPYKFYDLYNMDPKEWGERSYSGEILTRYGACHYLLGAEDFKVEYPCG